MLSDEGRTVPLPSPDAEHALRQAVALVRQGKRQEAAGLLQSSFSTAFSRGRTDFDALHFANAMTKLTLEDYITDGELHGLLMVEEINITLPEFHYIEDIAARDGVERFYFEHTGMFPDSLAVTREQPRPRDDPFPEIIARIMTALYPVTAFARSHLPRASLSHVLRARKTVRLLWNAS